MSAPKLKGCVILGYTDINAAGSRSLLGIDVDKFMIAPLHLQSLISDSTPKPASINTTTPGLETAVLLCEHKTKDVSLIIINTIFPSYQAHIVANEIIDLVANSNIKEFIILSALATGSNATFLKITNNDADSEMTQKLHCNNPFLNSLLQFSKVETFPTTLIAVDGRRAQKGRKANSFDGSQQAIEALLLYLKDELQLEICTEQSLSWVLDEDISSCNGDIPMFI